MLQTEHRFREVDLTLTDQNCSKYVFVQNGQTRLIIIDYASGHRYTYIV